MRLLDVVTEDHRHLTDLATALRDTVPGVDTRIATDRVVTAVAVHVAASRRHLCPLTRAGGPEYIAGLRALEVAAERLLRHSLGDVTVKTSAAMLTARLSRELARHIETEHDTLAGLDAAADVAEKFSAALPSGPTRPHPWLWRTGRLRVVVEPLVRRLDAARDVMDNRMPVGTRPGGQQPLPVKATGSIPGGEPSAA